MSDVKKGTIVWYYDEKLRDWKRGKVFCVNRWGIHVKQRHSGKTLYFRYTDPVVPASEPKPDCDSETLRKRRWNGYYYHSRFQGMVDKKYRFLMRLGLV